MEPAHVKQEHFEDSGGSVHDEPEGALPALEVVVPEGFNYDEWKELSEVFITVFYYSYC